MAFNFEAPWTGTQYIKSFRSLVDDKRVLRLPEDFSVDAGNGLVAELRVLLGPDAVLV